MPEIFVQDEERKHGFESACDEYVRLLSAYQRTGYQLSIIPRIDVAARADFVLDTLNA
jgi:predicted ATPase